eukprot:367928_1
MNTLKQQISATLSRSRSAEHEMELICAEVLLQKSSSCGASMDDDTEDESEIIEPLPDVYLSPKNQYNYSKLRIPSLHLPPSNPRHTSKSSKHTMIKNDASTTKTLIPPHKYTKLKTSPTPASATAITHTAP